MTRKIQLLFTMLNILGSFALFAQEATSLPEYQLQKSLVETQLRFLAADELEGRKTGSRGNNIAARYIAETFRSYGMKALAEDYYQPVPFVGLTPPQEASITINGQTFEQGEDLLIMTGLKTALEAKVVYAGHGWIDEETGHNDYKKLDVKGKIVLTVPGTPDSNDPYSVFRAVTKKRRIAIAQGAVALIELYKIQFPWSFFKQNFNKESIRIADEENSDDLEKIVYGWINASSDEFLEPIIKGKEKANLTTKSYQKRTIQAQNVVGLVEGTDPELKEEYILVTAHYDHVGTGKDGGAQFSPEDSIFNGARDNAMGTVALLSAAKVIAEQPTKRSVLFVAFTGEEMGLLGSAYYADHPVVPLEKTVFNLNNDGAGYNTTEAISIIGFGRTGVGDYILNSAKKFDLGVIENPVPQLGLYDRSDNVSFARKGVPAVNFSPGVIDFDAALQQNYHQVTDEAESLDFEYVLKFCQTFAHTLRNIANADKKPWWVEGDKYEKAGKRLYNR